MARTKKPLESLLYLKESFFENTKFVVLDVETTGLMDEDEVIQFSGIKINIATWEILEESSFYINIGKPLPDIIVNLTGITDQVLNTEGISKEEAAEKVKDFISDATICGHNVSFDIKKIQHLFDDTGLSYDMSIHKIVDTMKLAREYYPKSEVGNHKLGNLVETFELEEGLSFHNAIDDVIATMRLCKYIWEHKINIPTNEAQQEESQPQKIISGPVNEKAFARTPLPYIPKFPGKTGGIPVHVTKIARWKKSMQIDRIYINFEMDDQSKAQIYFDMHQCVYVDINGNYVDTIDMQSLQVQVCDIIWSNGFSGYDDFTGTLDD